MIRNQTSRCLILLLLGMLVFLTAFPAPGLASTSAPAGLPVIDPADPHRFFMDGRPWYPVGFYPAIAALTADQTDYSGYYKKLIDLQAAHGLNYFRNVFSIGQPYGESMTPYVRTGPGEAADGRPKFDLNQFNPAYFDYWREVISYARSKGVVVQLIIFDNWHNKAEIKEDNGDRQYEFGMKYDFYNSESNINGIGANSLSSWNNPSHPVFDYQKALVREVVDNLGDLPNIIFEISNENYENRAWELELADYLTEYEKSTGLASHLVMPRDLPNHSGDHGAGGHTNSPQTARSELIENRGKNQPLIADNDGTGDMDPNALREKAWAALTAGAHINYFHHGAYRIEVLESEETAERMEVLSLLRKFLQDFNVELRGMEPGDHLVSDGWSYARPGDRYIVYLIEGGDTRIEGLSGDFQAVWYNPRDGSSQPAVADGAEFTAPDDEDWVLYITSGSLTRTYLPAILAR